MLPAHKLQYLKGVINAMSLDPEPEKINIEGYPSEADLRVKPKVESFLWPTLFEPSQRIKFVLDKDFSDYIKDLESYPFKDCLNEALRNVDIKELNALRACEVRKMQERCVLDCRKIHLRISELDKECLGRSISSSSRSISESHSYSESESLSKSHSYSESDSLSK